jgi:molybdopterin molybdotransferase
MIELQEAIERILARIPPVQKEPILLNESPRRILASDVMALHDLPPFDNSAMDGYAVRSADTISATSENPKSLRVRAQIPAGSTFNEELAEGECARIFTGSPVPAGADAVVMQEDTQPEVTSPDIVKVLDSVRPFENIRLRGGDVKKGSPVGSAGQKITPGLVSLLAASGIREMNVGRRPRVGLLATGSELRETGSLLPGQIYESNRIMLQTLTGHLAHKTVIYPIVPDRLDETRKSLSQAFADCDIVITSGGASVGEMDFLKQAFQDIGGNLEFWKVSIRPGKPFVFGQRDGKFLFGLPGNPVSAFVTFLLLVRPALLQWQGAKNIFLQTHPGTLGEPLVNSGARRHYVRVQVDEQGDVFSAGLQSSHALGSLASANGFVDVPPHAKLAIGTTVKVMKWE